MYVLDINVLSELRSGKPHQAIGRARVGGDHSEQPVFSFVDHASRAGSRHPAPGACLERLGPIMPTAPGLFPTMTDWLRLSQSFGIRLDRRCHQRPTALQLAF